MAAILTLAFLAFAVMAFLLASFHLYRLFSQLLFLDGHLYLDDHLCLFNNLLFPFDYFNLKQD